MTLSKYANPSKSFKGKMTNRVHPEYPYRYGGNWFRTEKDRDEFRARQLTRKSAIRMGWPHETEEDLERFRVWREEQQELLRLRKERQAKELAERKALREEYGIGSSSNYYNFAAVMSKKGHAARASRLVLSVAESKMTDGQKLDLIKKMIEDRTPIQDFMIRTSQLVGVELRKVSNGKV